MNTNANDPNDELDGIERTIADDNSPLPPEVEARMRLHLNTLHARIAGLETPSGDNRENWIMSVIRNFKQGRVRLATSIALAVMLAVGAYLFFGNGSGSLSYAAVARLIREAQTLRCTMTTEIQTPGAAPISMKLLYKEPGLMRMQMDGPAGMGFDQYADFTKNKVVMLMPAMRQVMEVDVATFKQSSGMGAMIDEWKKLPAQASASREEQLNGARARVYEVADGHVKKTLWVGEEDGQILQYAMDLDASTTPVRVLMTDIEIDQPIDDAEVTCVVPADYSKQSVHLTMPDSDEKALAGMLRHFIDDSEDKQFPVELDPSKLMQMTKTLMPKMKPLGRKKDGTREEADVQAAIDDMAPMLAGVTFLQMLKPENDWHYAGKGVTYGYPADWIAWWKPTGSEDYRVLRGDLSITDATAQEAGRHASQP